ncbi:MAG: TIGR01906 family membrane protein [Defluviitaleaceae bacterium]|nr:TIGR01906 family membrane protein [Defluviitaleaceae bacterium]
MSKIILRAFSILNLISLIIVVLLTSVEIATFSRIFYRFEFGRNNSHEFVNITEEELDSVTSVLLDYMRGRREDLVVEVNIHGETREFFSEREKYHMIDVKDLYDAGHLIRNICILIYIITLVPILIIYKKKAIKEFLNCYRLGIPIFFGGLIILGALIFSSFDRAFTIFHEILFSNDLWLLDPRFDLMINILPLQFFINIFIFIMIMFVFTLLCIMAASHIVFKRLKRGVS